MYTYRPSNFEFSRQRLAPPQPRAEVQDDTWGALALLGAFLGQSPSLPVRPEPAIAEASEPSIPTPVETPLKEQPAVCDNEIVYS